MIGFAAGLSKAGYVPIVHTIAPFLVLRALDQIKIDFVYNMACNMGGMGFIEETGAAQHYRDARILPIYEGTNSIQAVDLVFRKLVNKNGDIINRYLDMIKNDANIVQKWAQNSPKIMEISYIFGACF